MRPYCQRLPLAGHARNGFKAKGERSSGPVEGMNTQAKLTLRNAFGFRTYEAMETALYHALGNLPEPKFTHRFC
ncbi:MAG: hypothetical protein GKR94_26225 [Gammaproteobacteria bacterium]|nr:hypothetical protein [Gammaproteobacteria bacterium]